MPKRRDLYRKYNFREQFPVILIATEGDETEPQYFAIFKKLNRNVLIRILPSKNKSAPVNVKKRMMKEIKENGIGDRDRAWLVIDRDTWTPDALDAAYNWSISNARYGLAVSNPMFEYWLILHFEEGDDIHTKKECKKRLLTHLPTYKKNKIQKDNFSVSRIQDAIIHARKKDSPPCIKWPETTGTTVYKLVEILIS